MNHSWHTHLACAVVANLALSLGLQPAWAQAPQGRPRVIIETDAGGDPDDEQSLVRFLLYANDFDIEGIICNRPVVIKGENLSGDKTGLEVVRRMVNAYGECHATLVKHDPRYLKPDVLMSRTVSGYEQDDDGEKLIVAAVDSADPRPVWFCNWGTINGTASSSLKRALDRVLKERGEQGYAAFKRRIYLSSDDQFGEHMTREPAFPLWVDTFRPELERKRWYHRFSALTATAGGFDLKRDVLTNHGPLGPLYPTNTTHVQKEGDTMTFLYLVPTGMNDPRQPTWGSWGGRYGLNPKFPGKPYYFANLADAWRGSTHRDNTVKRWAADLQNDFRARMDWCVKLFAEANHPPVPVVNGQGGTEIVSLTKAPGQIKLNAEGTKDPDGHELSYRWFVYLEAGTFEEDVSLGGDDSSELRILIPDEAVGKTVHVVLAVTDQGDPPLTRYRRVVIKCVEK